MCMKCSHMGLVMMCMRELSSRLERERERETEREREREGEIDR